MCKIKPPTPQIRTYRVELRQPPPFFEGQANFFQLMRCNQEINVLKYTFGLTMKILLNNFIYSKILLSPSKQILLQVILCSLSSSECLRILNSKIFSCKLCNSRV